MGEHGIFRKARGVGAGQFFRAKRRPRNGAQPGIAAQARLIDSRPDREPGVDRRPGLIFIDTKGQRQLVNVRGESGQKRKLLRRHLGKAIEPEPGDANF